MQHSKAVIALSRALRFSVAAILLQTLFFKFTSAKEPVCILSTPGPEPWGEIGNGIVELIAAILLLLPATVPCGALHSLGVIGGAIMSHLTKLGIALPAIDDHGGLFTLAVLLFVCSFILLARHFSELPFLRKV